MTGHLLDLLPLSALQHLVFCERQCALIHLEGQWRENPLTFEGREMHERVDQEAEEDSLRFYFLGRRWRNRREHHGIKNVLDPDEPMIV